MPIYRPWAMPQLIDRLKLSNIVDPTIRDTMDLKHFNEGEIDQDAGKNNDERMLLASLIGNLKLDVNENKMRNKDLKQANMILNLELEKHKHFHTNFKGKEEVERQCCIALCLKYEL
nr:probable receptor-like protein kinase At1g80640 [Tanacetum cinerariifolium]